LSKTALDNLIITDYNRKIVDITPTDFALIPVVLNEFDTVERTGEKKLGNKKLLFTKEIEGTIYLASI
jgi:hypothetical protein